jgi:ankyrin repeat protein
MLAHGADVNAVSEGGQTPLHLAAFHGKARETLELMFARPELRSAGKNAQGDTPAAIAARQGNCCLTYFDLLSEAITKVDEEAG